MTPGALDTIPTPCDRHPRFGSLRRAAVRIALGWSADAARSSPTVTSARSRRCRPAEPTRSLEVLGVPGQTRRDYQIGGPAATGGVPVYAARSNGLQQIPNMVLLGMVIEKGGPPGRCNRWPDPKWRTFGPRRVGGRGTGAGLPSKPCPMGWHRCQQRARIVHVVCPRVGFKRNPEGGARRHAQSRRRCHRWRTVCVASPDRRRADRLDELERSGRRRILPSRHRASHSSGGGLRHAQQPQGPHRFEEYGRPDAEPPTCWWRIWAFSNRLMSVATDHRRRVWTTSIVPVANESAVPTCMTSSKSGNAE